MATKSCFTCTHHKFDVAWLDNSVCVECMGKYSQHSTRKRYIYDAKVARRALGIDKWLDEGMSGGQK